MTHFFAVVVCRCCCVNLHGVYALTKLQDYRRWLLSINHISHTDFFNRLNVLDLNYKTLLQTKYNNGQHDKYLPDYIILDRYI